MGCYLFIYFFRSVRRKITKNFFFLVRPNVDSYYLFRFFHFYFCFSENPKDSYDRLPVLEYLKNAFLSEKWPSPYEDALARARTIPECPVVPFFGQFLRELKHIITSPSKVGIKKNKKIIETIHSSDSPQLRMKR